MNNPTKVLIISTHPFVTEAYETTLKQAFTKTKQLDILKICSDYSIDYFFNKNQAQIDLVLLDIDVLPSKDYKYIYGEDITLDLKK